jgi:O-antigen/teichoic acid export membrane protein
MRRGLAAEVVLGVIASLLLTAAGSALFVLGQGDFGAALLLLAPWLVFLLVQDFWRWAGFMWRRPDRSLINDAVFNLVQAGALVLLVLMGHRSLAVPIAAWGLGGMAGALLGLRQFSIGLPSRHGAALFREGWPTSRWLLAHFLTGWGSGQAFMVLGGAVLGPVGLGGLRAAQTLMAPSWVLVQVAGSIGLPEASRALERSGWAGLERVVRCLVVVSLLGVGAIAAVVLVAAPQLLRLVYGAGFDQYAPTARVFALALLLAAVGPAEVAVKVTGMARSLVTARLWNAALCLGALLALAPAVGVVGAAWAYGLGILVNIIILARIYRGIRGRLHGVTVDTGRPPAERLLPHGSA